MPSRADKRRPRIRRASAEDLPEAIALLDAARLPTEDVSSAQLSWVAVTGTRIQGVIGLEQFGDRALLRSLAVSPPARREGVGRSLVEALEASARESGVRTLWLLTTDAESFFSNLGYCRRARDSAPDEIRFTTEFSSLCPDDAVLMSKNIGAD